MKTTIAIKNFCKTLNCRCLTGFWICLSFWFWIYQDSKYVGVTQRSEYAQIISENVWICQICVNVSKSAWLVFVLFPHCNPLSTWMLGYLFQCLYKTRSWSLKNYEAAFLKRQNLIFFYSSWKYLICVFVLD